MNQKIRNIQIDTYLGFQYVNGRQAPKHIYLWQNQITQSVSNSRIQLRAQPQKQLQDIKGKVADQLELVKDSVTFNLEKAPEKVGFRWDAANNRWRKTKYKGEQPTMIKTKTGQDYVAWPYIYTQLSNHGLQSLDVEAAQKMAEKEGAIFIDIRLPSDFKKVHVEGAKNINLFRYVEGRTFWDNAKRVAMAGFAMKATERNPSFIKTAQEIISKNQKVIVYCSMGGSMNNFVKHAHKPAIRDPDRDFGWESRSLKACYDLIFEGGFKNVYHLKGGLSQWKYDGYPIETSN